MEKIILLNSRFECSTVIAQKFSTLKCVVTNKLAPLCTAIYKGPERQLTDQPTTKDSFSISHLNVHRLCFLQSLASLSCPNLRDCLPGYQGKR